MAEPVHVRLKGVGRRGAVVRRGGARVGGEVGRDEAAVVQEGGVGEEGRGGG